MAGGVGVAVVDERVVEMAVGHVGQEALVERLGELRRAIVVGEEHVDLVAAVFVFRAVVFVVALRRRSTNLSLAAYRAVDRPASWTTSNTLAMYLTFLLPCVVQRVAAVGALFVVQP